MLIFVAVFMPAAMLTYSLVPQRFRGYVLLLFSYAFIYIISGMPIVYLFACTGITYGTGLALEKILADRDQQIAQVKKGRKKIKEAAKKRMKRVFVAGLLLDAGMLFALNYLTFFGEVGMWFLGLFGLQVSLVPPSWAAPIGISFYTLMAISYLIDVFRETVKAEHHIGRLALYLSFFPHIMEGPIARYGQIAKSAWEGNPIRTDRLYRGMVRIAFGFVKKLIVADRLNIFVGKVFDNYTGFRGGMLAFAAILYTMQLYCDFSGCMDVGIGLGDIFGIDYPENFRQPFFSRTTSEFWQRWHITLGMWFKDYIYYPVSLAKSVKDLTKKARKRFGTRNGPLLVSGVALFCVWFLNGLWHGAGSQYLFFGMYYFVLIWLGGFVEPVARQFADDHGIDREGLPYRLFRMVRTWIVVFVGELFFRSASMEAGIGMLGRIFTHFNVEAFYNGELFKFGLDAQDFIIVAITLACVFARDWAYEHDLRLLDRLSEKGAVVRWGVWIALVMAVVIFGAYGYGYVPVDPMYASY